MLLKMNNKNSFNVVLNLSIDDAKKDVYFLIDFIEYGKRRKTYTFKTLKAAHNKYDTLCKKYIDTEEV